MSPHPACLFLFQFTLNKLSTGTLSPIFMFHLISWSPSPLLGLGRNKFPKRRVPAVKKGINYSCEWIVVAAESERIGIKGHVATIFEICIVKGAELDDKDPRKAFEGRAVLDGSWVKDENYDVALLNAMGSSPATMQAGKAVEVFGLQPGYTIEQADAEAAYNQMRFERYANLG